MARETLKIYAVLDDRQEYHQSTVVAVDSNIAKKSIYILIDARSSHSYATLKVVENCSLKKKKHSKFCLV